MEVEPRSLKTKINTTITNTINNVYKELLWKIWYKKKLTELKKSKD